MGGHRKQTHFSSFSYLSPESSPVRCDSQVIILIAHLEAPPVSQLWVPAQHTAPGALCQAPRCYVITWPPFSIPGHTSH